MGEEFEKITKHVVKYWWDKGYFTIPLPKKGRKEFKLDLPAFKKFDILVMKWKEQDNVEIKAVESKLEPEEAIPQALIYQLCTPEVYIASNTLIDDIDEDLKKLLKVCGIGYISVSDKEVCIKPKPKRRRGRSQLVPMYRDELLSRARAILGFYDFMEKGFGMEREDILEKIDYGVRTKWISDKKANSGIQWSLICDEDPVEFGINLECADVFRKCFSEKTEDEIKDLLNNIRKRLPPNFLIKFMRRCEKGKKPGRGGEYKKFSKLEWKKRKIGKLSKKDIELIPQIIKEEKEGYVWFGVYGEVCKRREFLSRDDFLGKLKDIKEKHLEQFYKRLK